MMADDQNWIDVTALGSAYEEQHEPHYNLWRHRPRRRSLDRFVRDPEMLHNVELEWRRGRAPAATKQPDHGAGFGRS